MTIDSKTSVEIEQLLVSWKSEARLKNIVALTPDASLRRYYRVQIETPAGLPLSIVAMIFDSVVCPEAGGQANLPSDQAYLLIAELFRNHQVRVPQILFADREKKIFLIEDLGDLLLNKVFEGEKKRFSPAEIDELFKQAVQQIVAIQRIPIDPQFFAFKRCFNREAYLHEMREFLDFVLTPYDASAHKRQVVEQLFLRIISELDKLPLVLVHRDFHSWNLIVSPEQSVSVLDFQDALMGPRTYDLVSLINDRDMDSRLGDLRCEMLKEYFQKESGFEDGFAREYQLVLLQRDLKVSGRFAKLFLNRGLGVYRRWIPGTLKRMARTAEFLANLEGLPSEFSQFRALLDELLEEAFLRRFLES